MVEYRRVVLVFAIVCIIASTGLMISGAFFHDCNGSIMLAVGGSVFAVAAITGMLAEWEVAEVFLMAWVVIAGFYSVLVLLLVIIGGILTAKGECIGKCLLTSAGSLFGYGLMFVLMTFVWFIVTFRDVDRVPSVPQPN